jgi:hypothetical protein
MKRVRRNHVAVAAIAVDVAVVVVDTVAAEETAAATVVVAEAADATKSFASPCY